MSWPDHRSVFYALGTFLSGLAALMLLPALADFVVADSNWTAFVASATVTGGVGGATILAFRTKHKPTIGRREGFLLITLSWVVSCIFAALPFMLSRERLGFADAFFESTSGLTTTGSTILADLEAESHGVLLWRALLHWVGGVGIIVIAVMLLPYLRVGGMQLFRAESSDQSDKIRARVSEMTWEIFSIYAVLTVLCAIALTMAGMPLFDSVCHAMSIISTGGFANRTVDRLLQGLDRMGDDPIHAGRRHGVCADGARSLAWRLARLARDTQTRWYFGISSRVVTGDALAGHSQRPCVRAGFRSSASPWSASAPPPASCRRTTRNGVRSPKPCSSCCCSSAAAPARPPRDQGVPLLHPRLRQWQLPPDPSASRAAAHLTACRSATTWCAPSSASSCCICSPWLGSERRRPRSTST
jgi:hypothetical protein